MHDDSNAVIRVGLIEPHRIYREAMRDMLLRAGFSVAFARAPEEASQIRECDVLLAAVDDDCDVVVNANDLVRRWRCNVVGAAVVVVLPEASPILANDFLIAGARGVIARHDTGAAILAGVLRAVEAGQICTSPAVFICACAPSPFPPRLTPAMLDVVRSLPMLHTKTQRQAAYAVGRNPETYRTLLQYVLEALGVDCWQQAVVVCQEFNLLPRRLRV